MFVFPYLLSHFNSNRVSYGVSNNSTEVPVHLPTLLQNDCKLATLENTKSFLKINVISSC